MSRISRRNFMKVAGFSALAVTAACNTPEAGVPAAPATARPPLPTQNAVTLANAPSEIKLTPVNQFYRQSYGEIPDVGAGGWRLTIDGLVQNPQSFTLDDLKALPAVEEMRTLECIGNPVGGPLIGNAVWKGVYLQTLLAAIQVRPEAIRAKFQAADDYFTSVYLEWITHPQTMLIYEMNGEPLTREHGFPLRILMPGLYGQKNPKWLTHIEFSDKIEGGYWEKQGWSDIASVQTNSIIQQPANLASVAGATVPVFGVAFAGSRKIAAVEVQVDDGEWQPTTLVQADSSLVWTQWSFDWPAKDGKHTLAVRAVDETGFVQTEKSQTLLGDAYPAGTSKIHSMVVKVNAG